MDKVLLTPEEAAQALSIGASRRIPVEAVRAYVAALAVDSAAVA